ncbi:hypothetical protein ROZALSC1DRAFT_26874 [Rozella allomycis CSF55]|uniref:ABC transporter domain-containing protein n=1 Tax=Rozella allomycis (strain CSF55) TaxID=988480 RepID=A0A4P9YQZ1_ROZAC|nr:hypothetical protein ROZALSC1DRAFT_26874 [Rozella allomycis CSF55]
MAESEIRESTLTRPKNSVHFTFKDLNYSVSIKKKKNALSKATILNKTILKSVTGEFKPGRLTAIMGNSGAGKTSLLNVLAGEVTDGEIKGEIRINGEKAKTSAVKKVSGFVFQDDLILSTMTVREAVNMSATLRLPDTLSVQEKADRVNEIIQVLGLEKAADTIVGDARVKGISGGERKRTAMAMEMVINPPVLFLDEPTSGLDTFTAYNVMKTLKDVAKEGRTIISTIHQPSSDIFHLFDDLILLSEGQIVYCGPAENMVSYLTEHGHPCPKHMNPADYVFMHVLNNSEEIEQRDNLGNKTNAKQNGAERIQTLIDAWKETKEAKAINESIEKASGCGLKDITVTETAGFSKQSNYLFGRAFKNAIRNKMIVRARFGQAIFMGLLIGLIYLNVQDSDMRGQAQNRIGAMYFIATNQIMGGAFGILAIFAAEKKVFLREFGAGYYSLFSFYISKILVELPFYVLSSFATVVIYYYMIGFQSPADKFFIHAGIICLESICAVGIGLMSASFFDDLAVALAVMPPVLITVIIFSGFFVNNGSIPNYLDWIKYLSPVKYGFTAITENEFIGLTFKNCVPRRNVRCDGEFALEQFSLNNEISVAENAAVLFGLGMALYICAYIGMWIITRNKK